MNIKSILKQANSFEKRVENFYKQGEMFVGIAKMASPQKIVALLNSYSSTTEFLYDLAKAQYYLVGEENVEDGQEDESTRVLAQAINTFAGQFHQLESKYM